MNAKAEYRVCARCVMDTTAPGIRFDSDGMCHLCSEFLERSSHLLFKSDTQRSLERERLIDRVKATGRGRRYDCVVGLSGGVDSAWALFQAVRRGLRPLAVHMDNGWDSELAQSNIENLVRKLGVDLYSYVIDWSEYRALMQAFFDADVVDVELLYDNAMQAVNYRLAAKEGARYILAGTNQATEGMRMPDDWNWYKQDRRNIYAIWRAHGAGGALRSFPALSTAERLYHEFVRRIRWVSFLDYFDYQKRHALEVLAEELGFRPYPYKHYESVFTRFYQGYLLPRKFGIDKRRLHFSTLIVSGQMARGEALEQLAHSPYPDPDQESQDVQYFLKKLGWTRGDLDAYLERPPRSHLAYSSEWPFWSRVARAVKRIRGTRAPAVA